MSRYILRASCSTPDPFVNLMSMATPASQIDPKNLTVIVGDKIQQNSNISIMPCSGGLCAEQLFTWENFDVVQQLDPSRLFFEPGSATVTLSMDLAAETNSAVAYADVSEDIPAGALAINLGSKGFQFNTSGLINGDEWGKLVYYEPGGLGLGWSFSANRYFNRRGNTVAGGLGIYMLGGLLPDVDYTTLSNVTNFSTTSAYPIYSMQVSRDQALITQIQGIDGVDGPQGYWSVQPMNYDRTTSASGRWGGVLYNGNATSPAFGAYRPFGWGALAYPTALQTSGASAPVGWNLRFPSYGPSTQDGYMMPCNTLSIPPGAFFTNTGLDLLKAQGSNPTNPTIAGKDWTTFWENASNVIHLEETAPFRIESPLFEAPINIQYIPNVQNGLSFVVPVTRVCNGVYFYMPIVQVTPPGSTIPATANIQMAAQQPNASTYFAPGVGRLQKWFTIKNVKLTVNMPFMYIDTPLQASRFFNTPVYMANYGKNVPVWIKYYFAPEYAENGQQLSPISAYTTASFQQIGSEMTGGYMQFTYSARQILNRMNSVFAAHNIAISGQWALSEVTIKRIIVSCTPVVDLVRLYRRLFEMTAFLNSLQGSVLAGGGMKVFSRCGPYISNGAPNKFWVEFSDIVSGGVGISNGVMTTAHFDVTPPASMNRGNRNNDYFAEMQNFEFADEVSLRMPDASSDSDSGGSVTIAFAPRPALNMPFSGETLNNPQSGGYLATGDVPPLTNAALAAYANGWFNNLNPFSDDYNIQYDYSNVQTPDNLPFLDYKMINFNERKIEIWIQLSVPLQIYTNDPFNTPVIVPQTAVVQQPPQNVVSGASTNGSGGNFLWG